MDETLDVRWFLLRWHRHAGFTEVEEFADQEEAFHQYIAAERHYDAATRGHDPELEVVLIGAESLEALRVAYPHYFSAGSRDERAEAILKGNNRLFA